jgi:peptidyl-prolyl cis-trans isomerase B (cyclophilin B)
MRKLAMVAVLALAIAGCGSSDKKSNDKAGAPIGPQTGSVAQQQQAGGCKKVSAPQPKPDGGQKKPKAKLDPGATYDLTFDTSCGTFVVQLDQKQSPHATASLVSLAQAKFFDDLTFSRIVPGFVIQGGDPTGTGSGGPGYSTVDKPPADARYTKGVVAMAKTQTEPPGTAGSQFYVVTGADAGLPPDYAIVGKVTDGQATVDAIGKLGDPNSGDQGTPLEPIVINSVTVEKR